nr:hypothetical protein CFP56_52775 [Quercus suber]
MRGVSTLMLPCRLACAHVDGAKRYIPDGSTRACLLDRRFGMITASRSLFSCSKRSSLFLRVQPAPAISRGMTKHPNCRATVDTLCTKPQSGVEWGHVKSEASEDYLHMYNVQLVA